MGKFTRALIVIVGGGFLFLALVAAMQGAYGAAIGALIFGGMVAFVGGVGWFHFKFPLPPLPAGSPTPNLFSELKRFKKHYPGWPSKLATYVALGLFVLVVGLRLLEFLRSTL